MEIKYMEHISIDEFGPEYVVRVSDPAIGMEGFLVIDSTVLGLGKGGIRMTSSVSEYEVYRLARTMTWKNALAGLPFGGAKGGIRWSGGNDELKEQYVRSFARRIAPLIPVQYIAGPDVNTGEREMQWIAEEVGLWEAATGKPAHYCSGTKCGLPHEYGSTGFGVAIATVHALRLLGQEIMGARVAIEGFGNVGSFACKFLEERGAKIVGVADSRAAVYRESGFTHEELSALKNEKGTFAASQKDPVISREEFFALDVDVLIPATVTDVITAAIAPTIRARLIVEGANIPMQESIENELYQRGVFFVPDMVANAGGVISSYAEYRGYRPEEMFALIEEKIGKSVDSVIARSLEEKKNPRVIACEFAQELVRAHRVNAALHVPLAV
jgi:glutamate dehydrogenase (NAD(P)+)